MQPTRSTHRGYKGDAEVFRSLPRQSKIKKYYKFKWKFSRCLRIASLGGKYRLMDDKILVN